ncbi:uncharacterized protein RCC_11372 [Ramularia collo-cygni]|uniref:peptidylprolyl isomerase n=1 Tax=Ramularia collo-cygni TaxID=112498 RepID=A0A2D3VSN5_9PEZI|nr:uncharacterized protein RCC_11372 [Ramularia collo-cygni]CZT25703.1 uncharacterized protein RCC_11372 [Ramularia collo-cygni]
MRASGAAALLSLLSTAATLPAPPSETLSSGLIIEHISGPATCDRPTRKHDKVAMHYRGSLLSNGEEFDQSYKRGKPFQFVLGTHQVIAGWDEGLMDMCIGASRKLTIPAELGYGSRGAPPHIPPDAVLVFETKLVDIVEFSKDKVTTTTSRVVSTSTESGTTTTVSSRPTSAPAPTRTPDVAEAKKPSDDTGPPQQAQCHLLGPFALVAQAGLGFLALLILIWKRWREVPKRPWKIFFFDVSKQVFGSMLVHVINLAMSMLSSVDVASAAAVAAEAIAESSDKSDGRVPNPCSFYVLNLGIDTTLGVPVLYVLLKLLHRIFAYTPLANPPESIKSGNYGQPPQVAWYFKQLLIYCIGLIGMKLFVFFLFMAMPFLPWIGDWALRWTEGSEALQVAFALFIFPLAMNAIQYWIVDGFIMDKKQAESGPEYQRVDEESSEEDTLVPEEVDVRVPSKDDGQPMLREVDPEPLGSRYADEGGSGRSR